MVNYNFLLSQTEDLNSLLSMFEDYDEKDFDEFFIRLGSSRSKKLIDLFFKLKTHVSNCVFDTVVFFLYIYICIRP